MSSRPLILAIDQGTTSSRAIVFDASGNTVALGQQEFPQVYPHEGWVEHDPEEIWSSTLAVCRKAIKQVEAIDGTVVAIGITNQRETTVAWNRTTGKPIYNAIVWQDRRTATTCDSIKKDVGEEAITRRTGLLLDPYFSASKIAWILDNVEGAREQAESGELAFGTIDCFLVWRLTGGRVHATDITNASRTNLFNIHELKWDDELLQIFNVPADVLPTVHPCTSNFGESDRELLGRSIPILGMAGDQQAASIGQCCFEPGEIKSTYGTGCFVMLNTGTEAVASRNRLLTTIACQLGEETTYALEGSIFVAGAAVQWLRDGLGIIESSGVTEELAKSRSGNDGVYLVPAFTGMGAPHWNPHARGTLFGLTRASGPAELVRATLESVCYQTADLLQAMAEDGILPKRIRVDGGMAANDWLMQFLSDILAIEVERPVVMETTALGAAYLAGLQAGVYEGLADLRNNWQQDRVFAPAMDTDERMSLLNDWKKAVDLSLQWAG